MVPPVGIIITVTILVAAGVAAYENPQVRAWIDRTRHKISMGLHTLGDEIHPNSSQRRRPSLNDASMHEDKSESADERRRQAIAEIMERGRIMEERNKRRKTTGPDRTRTSSFDTMVDENGMLLHEPGHGGAEPAASSSAVDTSAHSASLKQRQKPSQSDEVPTTLQHSMNLSHSRMQLSPLLIDQDNDTNLFESRYEQEMREAWSIPVSDRRLELPSSHASESLIDLTPTTEDAPDPDFSVPSAEHLHRPLGNSDYFRVSAGNSTPTLPDHDLQRLMPGQSPGSLPWIADDRSTPNNRAPTPTPSTGSLSGSMSNIHPSEAEENSDDLLSEEGDGIRTPASVWTEVDSTVSGDFN
ncbi:hypothetical protein A1O3_10238 [Capronia epimyces CBS 606.96]|uniref:Uncharacterized protein n=1 Tax=Capronia epimyces CBS 606.96 TaxID=1182542 RepID=W9XIA3_9EURO|nr:uncharacterized protein A1O3_10238 [Capronia epimyces CBS 606.96]EXJ77080.1 hypothetical protein A1O3_10238 [Capronia epimyces CBS 606.96]